MPEATPAKKGDDKRPPRRVDESPSYKSHMTPRSTTIITRRGASPAAMGGSMSGSITTSRQSRPMGGSMFTAASPGLTSTKNERQQEKKDMQSLNERLAAYIEKVRFLEAQNRKLEAEIGFLSDRWDGGSSGIKQMYETEIATAKEILEDTHAEKARLEAKLATLEDELTDLKAELAELEKANAADKETIFKQQQQLAEIEPELNMLRRRIELLQTDNNRDKKEIQRLQNELMRTKIDLDNESMAHMDAETRKQLLEDELETMKEKFDEELKELQALAYRDTTSDNREMWQSSMADALRRIQSDYDEKVDVMKNEMETTYNMKINEMTTGMQRQNAGSTVTKEETKKLKTTLNDLKNKFDDLDAKNALLEKQLKDLQDQLADKEKDWDAEKGDLQEILAKLKAELEQVNKESELLSDKKLSLELEMAAYRKLIQTGEENFGLKAQESGATLKNVLFGGAAPVIPGCIGKSTTEASAWKLSVVTSKTSGAGTDANVRMIIYGDKKQTPTIDLNKRNKKDFETGTVSEFTTDSLPDIGTPFKTRIWHDNKGLGPGWHLDKVVATHLKSGKVYTFNCNRWLARDEDDKEIVRECFAEGEGITPSKIVKYDVSILTNDSKFKEDPLPVLCLHGERGDTGERTLRKATTKNAKLFAPNQTDSFAVEAVSLGRINKISFGHNNKLGNSWNVERVIVKDQADPSFFAEFDIKRTFSTSDGDKIAFMDFTASKTSAGKM